jgi:uncharacterized protein
MERSGRSIGVPLDEKEVDALALAVSQFNSGHFFECHDTLEEIWQGKRGSVRDLLQGLIHVAVGFYHLGNSNLHGGESQLKKGLAKLETQGPEALGLDLETLRTETRRWLERVRSKESLRASVADLPKIRKALLLRQ